MCSSEFLSISMHQLVLSWLEKNTNGATKYNKRDSQDITNFQQENYIDIFTKCSAVHKFKKCEV